MKYENELKLWLQNATMDPDLKVELESVSANEDEVVDRFYRELEFGTGGLRGVIGAGTNRMNVYTIGKATQGLSEYINETSKNGSVALSYDSRIKSDLFAKTAASVFAANGIKVYLYPELMPTPMLSYAVRALGCDAGAMVTASHNPSKYNGYKVYGSDGCQLTLEASEIVLDKINNIDIFSGVKYADFDKALAEGTISYITWDVIDRYLTEVQRRAVNKNITDEVDLKVVYTPLHGSGNKPVRAILNRIGVKNVTVVKSQELPDGNFPTAPYPNPEIKQAFEESLKVAKEVQPDILLATDPDCDRVGIAVKNGDDYTLMTGNEVGCLLLDYILKGRTENGTLPKNPIAVKTIVTSEMSAKIAENYNCEIIDVLTGFKFIGEQIGLLEEKGEEERYVFGFEESYGYLAGGYVRDKDAVVASMLICEMAAYYKKQGKTLLQVMDDLYKTYGYYLLTQQSYTFEGKTGMEKMQQLMEDIRNNPPAEVGGMKVTVFKDYLTSVEKDITTGLTKEIELPSSNVLSFSLEGGASAIVRPSGTEPKIKVYVSAVGKTAEQTKEVAKAIEDSASLLLK